MNKRLRKKLGLGEFQDFIFQVRLNFDPSIDSDALMDDWIEVIEENDLWSGGGGRVGEWEFVISFDECITPQERTSGHGAVEQWLKHEKRISAYEISPIKADLIEAALRSKSAAQKQAARNAQIGIESILD